MNRNILNQLKEEAFANSVRHGWHEKELSDSHLFTLVITELCEAVAADRQDKRANIAAMEKEFDNVPDTEMVDLKNGFAMTIHTPDYRLLFERYIKDSVEDEIADSVIRMLDFCGLKKIDLREPVPFCYEEKDCETFTERIFDIISSVTNDYISLRYKCNIILEKLFRLAEDMNIDLMYHIRAKMAYNIDREYKHGKKY